MKRHFDLESAAADAAASPARVVTVGFFDGVHVGHAAILGELDAWSRDGRLETAVVTFDRHPQAVLGGHPPVPLVSLEHRLLLLERHGVDLTLVLPFDRALASWSPEKFADEVLHRGLGASRLLMGYDGAFGRGRAGTYDYVAAHRERFGVELRQAEPCFVGGERVSSTLIRGLLGAGELARVERLLGRPYSLLGVVTSGEQRGRHLGFPTANLDIGEAAVLPRGVYFADVARVAPPGESTRGDERWRAVLNVGRSPTFAAADDPDDIASHAFDPARDRVEAHLLDFDGDLYGESLEAHIFRKHREERRFPSVDALVAQIEQDVAARRAWSAR